MTSSGGPTPPPDDAEPLRLRDELDTRRQLRLASIEIEFSDQEAADSAADFLELMAERIRRTRKLKLITD